MIWGIWDKDGGRWIRLRHRDGFGGTVAYVGPDAQSDAERCACTQREVYGLDVEAKPIGLGSVAEVRADGSVVDADQSEQIRTLTAELDRVRKIATEAIQALAVCSSSDPTDAAYQVAATELRNELEGGGQ